MIRRVSWRGATVAAGLLVALVATSPAPRCAGAEVPPPGDKRYQVMAVFLYNFLSFIEWPAEGPLGEGPLLIGVLGDSPFGDAPRAIEKKQVGNRNVRFVFFADTDSVTPTHILFVTRERTADLPKLCRSLKGQPVLTAGEDDDFTRRGGVIRFYEVAVEDGGDRQLRVEVNEAAAHACRLQIRSKLLRLASLVNYPPEDPNR